MTEEGPACPLRIVTARVCDAVEFVFDGPRCEYAGYAVIVSQKISVDESTRETGAKQAIGQWCALRFRRIGST